MADDPGGAVVISRRVLEVRRRHATSVLVATHNDALARRADRVLRVRDGLLE